MRKLARLYFYRGIWVESSTLDKRTSSGVEPTGGQKMLLIGDLRGKMGIK